MAKILKEFDFPRNEYEQRIKKAKELLVKNNLDAMLVTEEVNLTYFSGFRSLMPWGSKTRTYLLHFCLIPRDGSPALVIHLAQRGNVESFSWIDDVRFFSTQDPIDLLADVVKEKGLAKGTVGMELGMNMRLDACINDYLAIRNTLPNMKIVDASNIIWELRTVKSPAEIKYLQKSCDISQKAVEATFQSLKIGMPEIEILKKVYQESLEAGATDLPLKMFYVIRTGPSRYPMRDTRASYTKKLERGDLVLIDGGVAYRGYMCDFIRQACIGNPTPRQKKLYDLELEAQNVALENIKAGVDGADVSKKSLEIFEKAGQAKNLTTTYIAHGIGLEIHEPPFVARVLPNTILKAGNTLSVEPFIYDPISIKYINEGVLEGDPEGCFIVEDEVEVTTNGIKNMTPMSKELYIVKV